MAILKRKIVHEANTLCSHFVYTSPCQLHRHREIQIILFMRGDGKQFVGDGVADFQPGDVALIGSNVPHFHLCDTLLKGNDGSLPNIREAVLISPDFFPAEMSGLPDYQELSLLLDESRYGIRFYGDGLFGKLRRLFAKLDGLRGIDRIAHVFGILTLLVSCKDMRRIASTVPDAEPVAADSPVDKIYTYLYEHFREDVRLEDVARYVRINPTALCRLFKKGTDKTVFQCLNDIRIAHACRLLAHTDLTVSQIGYEVGYGSIPYFIQRFKQKVRQLPGEYRRTIRIR